MKFLDLGLLKFGPFTEVVLDFSAGGNLQLVYGPNEAGKSTALRAIGGFLYGIDARTPDSHLHENSALRISAQLVNGDGEWVHLVRRKGNKDTLLDPDERPVDEATLSAWLGGVGEAYFSKMFGLDHAALVRGGEELLAGEGELGQVLFGVGAGVGSMRKLLVELRKEAAEIFKARGTKQPLGRALADYKDARKQSKQAALKPNAYKGVITQLANVEKQLDEVGARCADALNKRARLDRLSRVIPVLGRKRDLEHQLRELGDCPRLSERAPQERVAAQKALSKLEVQRDKLLADREGNVAARDGLEVPERLLDAEAVLDQLAEDLGAERTASKDCTGLESRVAAAEDELRDMLRDLGKNVALDEVEGLEVEAPLRARIRDLAQEHGSVRTELAAANSNLEEAGAKATKLEESLASLPEGVDVGALRRAVDQGRRAGDLEERRGKLEAEITRRELDLSDALAALPLWHGPLDELMKLPVPAPEVVELFRVRLEQNATDVRGAREAVNQALAKLDEVDEAIAALQEQGAVPTQAELEDARQRRDGLWSRARTAWLSDGPTGDEGPVKLADDLGGAIFEADRVADRLREDAERVGKLSTLTTERQRWENARARQEAEVAKLAKDRDIALAEWLQHWTAVGIEPTSPSEMRAWLAKHEKLVDAARALREQRMSRDELDAEVEAHRVRCGDELEALGEAPAEPAETLSAIIDRGAEVGDAADENQRTRSQYTAELTELRASKDGLAAKAQRCQTAHDEWEASWSAAMAELDLSAATTTAEADALLDGLRKLSEKWSTIRQTRLRIEHIEKKADVFAERVEGLVRECAPDLAGRSAQDAAAELVKRVREARSARDARDSANKRIEEISEGLRDIEADLEQERNVLERLVKEARVASAEELEAAEARSAARHALEDKLAAAIEQLENENVPVEQLIDEARDVDVDTLPGQLDAIAHELERAEADRDEIQRRAADLRVQKQAMDGSSEAADQAVRAQWALADVRVHAEAYACLTPAARVLDDEVERYRRDNQGPILQRAGEMFARLTCGSFAGLATGFGKGDQAVLRCERPNGEALAIEALSDGTRDQLYLALRLASLEQRAQVNEPLPLILDDLLINFDDDRAQAALELLSEVSETTQVLFFTHHSRLLELADAVVPSDRWRKHDLYALSRASVA